MSFNEISSRFGLNKYSAENLFFNAGFSSNAVSANSKTGENKEVFITVTGNDSLHDIEYRALWYAAKEAGLPREERNKYAAANATGDIKFVKGDPSPNTDSTVRKDDLKSMIGRTVPFTLSNGQTADLARRRDDYVARGGKLFSGQEAPPVIPQEALAQKNGIDEAALKRAQLENQISAPTERKPVLPVPSPHPDPVKDKLNEQARNMPAVPVELPTTPENADKLSITIQTFIPMETVEAPNNPLQAPLSPAIGTFEGDGREVDQRTVTKNGNQKESTYRTTQTMDIDFNMPEGVDVGIQKTGQSGLSQELWKKDTNIAIRTERADGTTLKATARREGNIIIIKTQGAEVNPLVKGAPAINYEMEIRVEKQKDGSLTMTTIGKHDGFPGYEMFIARPDCPKSDRKLVYGFDPRKTGNTPLNLIGDVFDRTTVLNKTQIVPQTVNQPK